MQYGGKNTEVGEKTPLGVIVHHPKFGIALKERMDKLGIECVVLYPDNPAPAQRVTAVSFLLEHLKGTARGRRKK